MARRRSRLVLTYALILLPLLVFHGVRALETEVNSPLDWAPPTDPDRARYDALTDRFGSGDVVILSWQGCDLYDDRIDLLTNALRRQENFFFEGRWLFDNVVSGRELAAQFVQQGQSPAQASKRLMGTFLGPDNRTTLVIVGFTKEGVQRRAELVPLIQQAVTDTCGVSRAELHLAGPIMDGLSVDHACQATLQSLAPVSSLVVFLASFWCLGSWRDAILVFGVALYSQLLTLALISLAGDSVSALLVVLPPLIQVLAIAAGMHLVNYYRDASRRGSSSAAHDALRIGWLPCVMSAATTAIGMASLMVSDLTPIRSFGAYAAMGVCGTAAAVLLLVPTFLNCWRDSAQNDRSKNPRSEYGWSLLTGVISANHGFVTLVFLVLMIVSVVGVRRLDTSVRIETLFPANSKILSDYRWLEKHVGSLVPIDVLLSFAPEHAKHVESQIQYVQYFDRILAEQKGVSGTLSAATFIASTTTSPDMTLANDDSADTAATYGATLQQVFRDNRLLHISSRNETNWRIRGFVSARSAINYGDLVLDVERQLQARLADPMKNPLAGVRVEATGMMPLVHTIQRQLLTDLQKSFLLAFAIILIMMTVMQAGLLAGIVAMLPNVFPSLILFGWLGWNDIEVDIGSVMTASVALGVAVDDTLHFLVAYQRGMGRGMLRRDAVQFAFFHCGNAMLQTSISCAAGMAVFAASDFLPTARFAWMMMALFTAAIVGDLVFLPAILIGPLGRLFVDPDIEDAESETAQAASAKRSPARHSIRPKRRRRIDSTG